MILCMGNKIKNVMYKLKDVITSEKGIICKKDHLDLMISASNCYLFWKIYIIVY